VARGACDPRPVQLSVSSIQEVLAIYNEGNERRATAVSKVRYVLSHAIDSSAAQATAMNSNSSRSHCVMIIDVHKTEANGHEVSPILCP
jgi:hypothetical protein